MNKPAIYRLLVRWFVCSLGLWLAARFWSSSIQYGSHLSVIIIAGLILALVNIVIRPVLIILSLPALIFTLGLFMIVINGVLVYVVSLLYEPLNISNFWAAVFAGMVIGLVNYLVTAILDGMGKDKDEHI